MVAVDRQHDDMTVVIHLTLFYILCEASQTINDNGHVVVTSDEGEKAVSNTNVLLFYSTV